MDIRKIFNPLYRFSDFMMNFGDLATEDTELSDPDRRFSNFTNFIHRKQKIVFRSMALANTQMLRIWMKSISN